MEKRKCQCGKLVQIDFPFCPYCGHATYDVKHWNKEVAVNDEIWYEPAFVEYPSIISHEYWRIRDMLSKEEIFGALWQLKDFYEVLLKYPILIVAAYLYQEDENNEDTKEFLWELLGDRLSLGDWEGLGYKAKKVLKKHQTNRNPMVKALRNVIENVLELYKNYKIANWRNETLAHGALRFAADAAFIDEFENHLKRICDYLKRQRSNYIYLIPQLDDGETFHELVGVQMARNLKFEKGYLIIRDNSLLEDNQIIRLDPFIIFLKQGIFLFDGIEEKKQLSDMLNYPDGIKIKKEDKVISEYKKILKKIHARASRPMGNDSVEGKTRSTKMDRWLEFVLPADVHVRPDFLLDWLEETVTKYKKGMFHIQMPRSSGKSTFVRGVISGEFVRKNDIWKTLQFRAFFVDEFRNNTVDKFVGNLYVGLLMNNDGKREIEDPPILNIRKGVSGGEAIAEYISFMKEEYKKYYRTEKLIIFVDGIDSTASKACEDMIKGLPNVDYLDEGVYVILLTTDDKELSRHVVEGIADLNITNNAIFREDNEDYQKYMNLIFAGEDSLDKNLGEQEPKYKALSLRGWIKLYKPEMLRNFNEADACKAFLKSLKHCYSDKYFERAQRILYIMAIADEPITIKELSGLLGDDYISYEYLGMLSDLKSLFHIENSWRGRTLSLESSEFSKELLEMLKKDEKAQLMVCDWFQEFIPSDFFDNDTGCSLFDLDDKLELNDFSLDNDVALLFFKMLAVNGGSHAGIKGYLEMITGKIVLSSKNIAILSKDIDYMPKYIVQRLEKVLNYISKQDSMLEFWNDKKREIELLPDVNQETNLISQRLVAFEEYKIILNLISSIVFRMGCLIEYELENTLEIKKYIEDKKETLAKCVGWANLQLKKTIPIEDDSSTISRMDKDLKKLAHLINILVSSYDSMCSAVDFDNGEVVTAINEVSHAIDVIAKTTEQLEILSKNEIASILPNLEGLRGIYNIKIGNKPEGFAAINESAKKILENYSQNIMKQTMIPLMAQVLSSYGNFQEASLINEECLERLRRQHFADEKECITAWLKIGNEIVESNIIQENIQQARLYIEEILEETKNMGYYVWPEDSECFSIRDKLLFLDELYSMSIGEKTREQVSANKLIAIKKIRESEMKKENSEPGFSFTNNHTSWVNYEVMVLVLLMKLLVDMSKFAVENLDDYDNMQGFLNAHIEKTQTVINDVFWDFNKRYLTEMEGTAEKEWFLKIINVIISLLIVNIALENILLICSMETMDTMSKKMTESLEKSLLQCNESIEILEKILSLESTKNKPIAVSDDLKIIGFDTISNEIPMVIRLSVQKVFIIMLRSEILGILEKPELKMKDRTLAYDFVQELNNKKWISKENLEIFIPANNLSISFSIMTDGPAYIGKKEEVRYCESVETEKEVIWTADKEKIIKNSRCPLPYEQRAILGETLKLQGEWIKGTDNRQAKNEIFGYCWSILNDNKKEVFLAVADSYKGGDGGKLLARLAADYLSRTTDDCQNLPVKHVKLTMQSSNPDALDLNGMFYSKGFEAIISLDNNEEITEETAGKFIEKHQDASSCLPIVYIKNFS